MGVLDRRHAERRQRAGHQADTPSGDLGAEPDRQPDGSQVEQTGRHSTDEMNVAVVREAEPPGDETHEKQRQSSVDEESIVVIGGIQWRARRVEVLGDGVRRHDRRLHHRQEALVWMKVLALVPIEPMEAEDRRHREQGDRAESGRALRRRPGLAIHDTQLAAPRRRS